MKSSKISSDKSKIIKTSFINGNNETKKSHSTEGFNAKYSVKNLAKVTKSKNVRSNFGKLNDAFTDRDVAELAFNEEFGAAFEKFWKTVTDGIVKQSHDSMHKNTPIDAKILEMQKRIKLNQAVLKNANERMRGITFATERQNLSHWKEGLAFKNPSREDLNRFKDVKALDLEIQKLRDNKPDRNVFLKSSPGIANFHETMENTLNMLDKIQKADEILNEDDTNYRGIKSEINLNFIKTPNLVTVSDEE